MNYRIDKPTPDSHNLRIDLIVEEVTSIGMDPDMTAFHQEIASAFN